MKSSYVQAGDIRMHYLQQGTGDPVLLIHGFPETSFEWRKQFPVLSERYAVFAPDTRGFGKTDKPAGRYSRRLLGGDIIRFMDAVGIEKAAVVGHDWGGIIAFKVAIDWPERVTRLALLDTLCTVWAPGAVHGYWFKAKPLPERFFARYHRQFIETIFAGGSVPALPGRPASPWQYPANAMNVWASRDEVEYYAEAFKDPASHAAAISYYRYALPFHRVIPDEKAPGGERYQRLSAREVGQMWRSGLEQHPYYKDLMDYGPEDRHKRFDKPALWMYGSYTARAAGSSKAPDEAPRGNPFFDQFPRYFPKLETMGVNAGHFFPEEAPDVTNGRLMQFLGSR
jgi:pimeloyl-ACP methyl ester carboxylesterase